MKFANVLHIRWAGSVFYLVKIVRNFADHLAKRPLSSSVGLNGPQMLFLLSTGEEKDLNVVRGWIKKTVAAT